MLYAAYGSNLHPHRLQQRTPSAKLLGPATLKGKTLCFHKRGYRDFSGKCNIAAQPGSTVHLALYDIPPAELPSLDAAEGAGAGYDRVAIALPKVGKCITYIANPSHTDDSLLPFSWYKALVLAGCEYMRFPADYIEQVRSLPAVEDSDRRRHNQHMQLVKTCQQNLPKQQHWNLNASQ